MLRSRKQSRRSPARRQSRARKPRPKTRLELIFSWLFGGSSKKSARRKIRQRSSLPFNTLFYWGGVVALWAIIIFAGALAYVSVTIPPEVIASVKKRPPNVTLVAADGSRIAERGLRRGYVRLRHMPKYLVNAVLATEDRRFRSHYGIDPFGLARALYKNAQARAVVEGGSTITQQLAKNLFLTPERTISRKLQEAVLAVWLESQMTKNEILELYLNRVYLGAGTYGIEAASQRYFGKPARKVTVAEAALLAGLLKAPSRYAPTRNPKLAEARASEVLANMVEARLLTANQAMSAMAQPADVKNPSGITGYEYAADWVMDLLPGLVPEWSSDIVVETTIDPSLQRRAQTIVSSTLTRYGKTRNASQAAAIVLDTSGAVRAMIGGASYRESQYNRAVKARRQPGSAFKPFVYLAALESGFTPDTLVNDAPININGWRPANYKKEYLGQITMRESLARSANTVAIRLTMEAGRWRVARTAKRLGIESDLHNNLSIALGTAEVSLLELVSSYAPFANGGYVSSPHIVKRIRTPKGKVLYQRKTIGQPLAIAPSHVGPMNDMMQEVIISGTGRSAAIPGWPSAGKTGTTQNFRDAWFVGYTANFIAGVWVGNDDGSPMKKVTGGSIPANIWREVMVEAHRANKPSPLPGTGAPAIAARMPEAIDRAATQVRSFFDKVLGVFQPSG